MIDQSIYREKGYKGRGDYLRKLAEDYGVSYEVILGISSALGPSEDFDGLVVEVSDYSERQLYRS